MSLVRTADLRALDVQFVDKFNAVFAPLTIDFTGRVVTIPVTKGTVKHLIVDQFKGMTKWIGDKDIQDLSARVMNVDVDPYEDSFYLDRHDFEDDGGVGAVMYGAPRLAASAARWVDDLYYNALTAATSAPLNAADTLDGLSFYNTAHTLNPAGTQSNSLSNALDATNFATSYAAMLAFTGKNGKPLGVIPAVLEVAPQKQKAAEDILFAAFTPGGNGGSNTLYGKTRLVVNPRLAAASTRWYLHGELNGVSAFVLYQREAPNVKFNGFGSDADFLSRQLIWSAEARGAIYPTLWFLSISSIG